MTRTIAALATLSLVATAACGPAVYAPGARTRIEMDPPFEIDDDDIAKAFAARPQLPGQLSVAYFALDAQRAADIEAMLEGVEGVARIYPIPKLMVTGERRFAQRAPAHWQPPDPKPLSIKKLRLLAARAQCDVLVVVDDGYRIERSVNGWVALAPLLVPLLIAPWLEADVASYLEAYLVDTRNGYLYGRIEATEEGEAGAMTIYSDAESELTERQWGALLEQTGAALTRLVAGGGPTTASASAE